MKNPNEMTEEEQIEYIKINWLDGIKNIKNPSLEIQKIAVQKYVDNIRYINNPHIEVQKLAVQQNGLNIQYIKNPSEEIQKLAVSKTGCAIQYINNPAEEIQLIAVNKNPFAIFDILNPTKEALRESIKIFNKNIDIPFDINKLSEDDQLKLVKQDELFIGLIDNPSIEIQLSILNNKYTLFIKFIKNIPEDLQIKFLLKDINFFYYLENPSESTIRLYNILTDGE